MAIETKEDVEEEKRLAKEIENKIWESAIKDPGPLDRSVELFSLMAIPFTVLYLWFGGSNFQLLSVLLVCFLLLSFVGGVITNVKVKIPELEAAKAASEAKAKLAAAK